MESTSTEEKEGGEGSGDAAKTEGEALPEEKPPTTALDIAAG